MTNYKHVLFIVDTQAIDITQKDVCTPFKSLLHLITKESLFKSCHCKMLNSEEQKMFHTLQKQLQNLLFNTKVDSR